MTHLANFFIVWLEGFPLEKTHENEMTGKPEYFEWQFSMTSNIHVRDCHKQSAVKQQRRQSPRPKENNSTGTCTRKQVHMLSKHMYNSQRKKIPRLLVSALFR